MGLALGQQQPGPGQRVPLARLIEDVEGPAVGLGRLGEGEQTGRMLGGQQRVAVGALGTAGGDGLEVVVGECGGVPLEIVGVKRFERSSMKLAQTWRSKCGNSSGSSPPCR
jgi:hypothetical protein